jgi:hypothetical protein
MFNAKNKPLPTRREAREAAKARAAGRGHRHTVIPDPFSDGFLVVRASKHERNMQWRRKHYNGPQKVTAVDFGLEQLDPAAYGLRRAA